MRSSSSHVLDPLTAGSFSGSSDEDLPEFSSQSDLDSVTFAPSEGSAESDVQYTITRLQEVELERSNTLSLTQRVEMNRSILQQLLRSPAAIGQSEIMGDNNTGSDLDVSDSEDQQNGSIYSEQTSASPLPHPPPLSRAAGVCVRPFVCARLPRQQQCADGARMKRRPEPLRADHNLLAPDTRSLSGVRHCTVAQFNSLPGPIQTAGRSTRRRPESSPNRRLRFEDETEKEAESRYLERQKRRAGQRGQDILVSKPDVFQYVNGRHKAGHAVDSQNNAQLGVSLQLHPTPPVYSQGQILYPIPPARPVISLRTEPIKETYIGVVTYSDIDGGETVEQVEQRSASNTGRGTNHINHNGFHKQAMPNSDLPINPYAPEQTLLPSAAQSTHKVNSSSIFSPSPPKPAHNGKHHDTRTQRKRNQKINKAKDQKCQNFDQTENPIEREASVEKTPKGLLQTQGHGRVVESSLDAKLKASSFSSLSAGVSQTLSASNSNGRSKQSMKSEHHSPLEPVEGSRLSLRRLFSSVRLGRSRASSLDRFSSRSSPPDTETPPGPTKPYGLLKKTPSVQSLTTGSPFLKLRKSASVQNFVTEQKKDRSENYKPAAQSALQRCLSVEDVSCPSSLRSVGRILQVYSDGTLLLELSRPKGHTYGFIISRGKGRTDSGVYVDDMVDSSTEKLYAGLLAVGDEILEVNDEKVACLSLDQVTHLLTHGSTVTVRVLRQRKPPAR